MASREFIHLHNHSEYSLLDGMSNIPSIVKTAAADGARAVGLNDHGTMAGIIELIKEAKKADIKPVIGMEGYFSKSIDPEASADDKKNYHLLLMARNHSGYQNLMRLSSEAHRHLSFNKPRFDMNLLQQHSSGLIGTTSCLSGIVNRLLVDGDRKGALQWASDLKDVFDPGSFFVELQNHGIKEQLKILDDQVWLGKQLNIPLLATNDSHFTDKEDGPTHEALLCIGTGTTLSDPNRFKFDGEGHWFRSGQAMWDLFPEDDFPGACSNTIMVAEMVEDDIVDISGNVHLIPKFKLPDGFDSSTQYLRHLAFEGAEKLYGNSDGVIPNRVRDQLDHEIRVIDKMGFPDYFLVYGGILNHVRSRGGLVGPGRGSAAGSCVSYCLQITLLDPLHHGLSFERFLNEGRHQMPDIDVDFDANGRAIAMEYVTALYGKDSVAYINTFGTLKPRGAIRYAVKVTGGSMDDEDRLSTLYPDGPPPFSLNTALTKDKSEIDSSIRNKWNSDGLKELRRIHSRPGFDSDALDLALNVEGVIKGNGIHAAAVLLTPGKLTDYFPLRTSDKDDTWVCQYSKDYAEAVGGLKMDFLGLSNLSLISRAVELIESDMGRRIDINKLPLNDKAVYDLLSRGETDGVFQVASPGMTELVMRLQPTEFSHIAALTALYRPGPMANDVHNDFADRKNGRQKVEIFHPDARKILEETFSLIVYQEQIMQLAQHYAGYSAVEADNFRKAMGKKDADVMAAQYDRFTSGVIKQNYTQAIAKQLWDLIEPFSGYAFNKSHSVAYGLITYQTAWLKANYPAQYAAACIDILSKDRVPRQVDASRRQGIQVYAPDVNKSGHRSVTSKDSVWLGMSGIAYLGADPIYSISHERLRHGNYKSLPDFLKRTAPLGVNQRAAINLVHAGAFDSLHGSRKLMAEAIPTMIVDAKNVASEELDDEESMFDFSDDIESVLDQYVLDGEEYSPSMKSAMELDSIGFFTGTHPFVDYQKKVPKAMLNGIIPKDAVTPNDESVEPGARGIHIYGVITEIEQKRKRDKIRTHFSLESGHGSSIRGVIFGTHIPREDKGKLVWVKANIRAAFESANDMQSEDDQLEDTLVIDSESTKTAVEMNCDIVRVVDMSDVESAPSLRAVKDSDNKVVDIRSRRTRDKEGGSTRSKPKPETPDPKPEAKPKAVQAEKAKPTPKAAPNARSKPKPEAEVAVEVAVEVEAEVKPREEADAYRFLAEDVEDLQLLSSMINEYIGGEKIILISLQGQDHQLPVGFDLDFDRVSSIAAKISIDFEELQGEVS